MSWPSIGLPLSQPLKQKGLPPVKAPKALYAQTQHDPVEDSLKQLFLRVAVLKESSRELLNAYLTQNSVNGPINVSQVEVIADQIKAWTKSFEQEAMKHSLKTTALRRLLMTAVNDIWSDILVLRGAERGSQIQHLSEISPDLIVRLPLASFTQIYPSISYLPEGMDAHLIAQGRAEPLIQLSPSRSQVLTSLLKGYATTVNSATYINTVRCLTGLVSLGHMAPINALSGTNNSVEKKSLCLRLNNDELWNIAKSNFVDAQVEASFRKLLQSTIFTPQDLFTPEFKEFLAREVITTGGSEFPLSSNYIDLYIFPHLYERPTIEASSASEQNQSKWFDIRRYTPSYIFDSNLSESSNPNSKDTFSASDLTYLRSVLDKNVIRPFIVSSRKNPLPEIHQFTLHPSIYEKFYSLAEESDFSLGALPSDKSEFQRLVNNAEVLTFSEFLEKEIANYPLKLSDLKTTQLASVLPALLVEAKKEQLLVLTSKFISATQLNPVDDDEFNETLATIYENIIIPSVTEHMARLKQSGELAKWSLLIAKSVKANERLHSPLKTAKADYVKKLVDASLRIHKYVSTNNLSELPFDPQVMRSAIANELSQMSSEVNDWLDELATQPTHEVAQQRFLEIQDGIREKAAKDYGRQAFTPCNASTLNRLWGANKAKSTGDQIKDDEVDSLNKDYCDLRTLGRWFGWSESTKAPTTLQDVWHGISLDYVNGDLSDLELRYRKMLRVREYIALRPLEIRQKSFGIYVNQPDLDDNKVFQKQGPALYQLLAKLSQQGHTANDIEIRREVNLALLETKKNLTSLISKIAQAQKPKDLQPLIVHNQLVNYLLGKAQLDNNQHLAELSFAPGLRRSQEALSSSAIMASMLEYHNEVQRELAINDNLNADIWDDFVHAGESGIMPIIIIWATGRLLGGGVGAIVNQLAVHTSRAVSGYWIYVTALFGADAVAMFGPRRRYIISEDNAYRQTSITEAFAGQLALLDAESYFHMNNYFSRYMSQTLNRGWWSAAFFALPAFTVPGIRAYETFVKTRWITKREARLSEYSKQYYANGDIESFKHLKKYAKFGQRVEKRFTRLAKIHKYDFKNLKLSKPTWDPYELSAALERIKASGTIDEIARAEGAYRRIILRAGDEVRSIVGHTTTQQYYSQVLFKSPNGDEKFVELLTEYTALIKAGRP